jgi:hypothetical protein
MTPLKPSIDTRFHTIGCESFPEFDGTPVELPGNSYTRPYQQSKAVSRNASPAESERTSAFSLASL